MNRDWYPSTSAFLKATEINQKAHEVVKDEAEISRRITARSELDDIYHRLQALMLEVRDPHVLADLQSISNDLYGQLR